MAIGTYPEGSIIDNVSLHPMLLQVINVVHASMNKEDKALYLVCLTSRRVMVEGMVFVRTGLLSFTSRTVITTETKDTALRTSPRPFVLHA